MAEDDAVLGYLRSVESTKFVIHFLCGDCGYRPYI